MDEHKLVMKNKKNDEAEYFHLGTAEKRKINLMWYLVMKEEVLVCQQEKQKTL